MKLITVVDDFGEAHTININAITEFVPTVPNKIGSGAIELNNGRRIITSEKRLNEVVKFLTEDEDTKKGKKNG